MRRLCFGIAMLVVAISLPFWFAYYLLDALVHWLIAETDEEPWL